ncbi:MAG: DNA (cytosine-5-)-methyltransferase [Bacteroidales bacterium]|nr:DNA (cytosine-5-)-methyltransferase [Bacteroidales bacterium]
MNKGKIYNETRVRLRVFEAFAGYGGASFALRRLKRKGFLDYNIIGFSEIDKKAIELFKYNFKNIPSLGDITQIDEVQLPDFDLFTGGFPCQPFSTAGSRGGEEDDRGTLFGDIIRICEYKQPQYILLENVQGLTTGTLRPTFDKILSELRRIGYDCQWRLLNSKDYGVPQNRLRLWIFGTLGQLPGGFELTPPVKRLRRKLKDFLDKNPDESLYRSPQQMAHIHEIHNNAPFDVPEPLCYDYYNRRIRMDGICMTVTPPQHNVVRIVEPMLNGQERFRKLSVDEHFRLMGFNINSRVREIKYPANQTYSELGRMAGNGWDINLVSILIEHIFSQF